MLECRVFEVKYFQYIVFARVLRSIRGCERRKSNQDGEAPFLAAREAEKP